MKKLLSILLALILVLGIVPASVFADDPVYFKLVDPSNGLQEDTYVITTDGQKPSTAWIVTQMDLPSAIYDQATGYNGQTKCFAIEMANEDGTGSGKYLAMDIPDTARSATGGLVSGCSLKLVEIGEGKTQTTFDKLSVWLVSQNNLGFFVWNKGASGRVPALLNLCLNNANVSFYTNAGYPNKFHAKNDSTITKDPTQLEGSSQYYISNADGTHFLAYDAKTKTFVIETRRYVNQTAIYNNKGADLENYTTDVTSNADKTLIIDPDSDIVWTINPTSHESDPTTYKISNKPDANTYYIKYQGVQPIDIIGIVDSSNEWILVGPNDEHLQSSNGDYYLQFDGSFRISEDGPESLSFYELAVPVTCGTVSNGTLTTDMNYAVKGETITVTATPASGYELDTFTYTYEGESAEPMVGNTLVMSSPAKAVTFNATFKAIPAPAPVGGSVAPARKPTTWDKCLKDDLCPIYTFTDAQPPQWYHNGVHFCLDEGYMIGFDKDNFKPNDSMTRAQIAMILWRIDGEGYVDYAFPFTDCTDKWCQEAIRWASAEGVVTGFSKTMFAPGKAITREELAAMLYRFAKKSGRDVAKDTENTNTLSYSDIFDVSTWATEGVHWCLATGILEGYEDGTVKPNDTLTRAEGAAMIQRFCILK